MRNYNAIVKQVLDEVDDRTKKTAIASNYLPWWQAWYSGYVKVFHHYFVYNGNKRIYYDKKQLNMAKRVCEDWASLLMSEKVQVVINQDNDKFQDLLQRVSFWVKMNQATEYGFALSYSGVVVDFENIETDDNGNLKKSDNTNITLNYYDATKCVPITFENREITECAFVSINTTHTNINLHLRDEKGNYYIVLYRKETENGIDNETYTEIRTTSKKPFFQIIHPNIANNKCLNYPYPLSIFANAIDTLEALDNAYDALDNEIVLGRKRIFVSGDLNTMKYEEGEPRIESVFDPKDSLIYGLPGGTGKDDKPALWSPNDQLRVTDLVMAINQNLKILSAKVGLGNDYYNFDKVNGQVTATQVISEKSDTFRNMRKHQLLMRNVIANIAEALIYANNEFTTNDTIHYETPNVIFDDSVIEDKESEQKRDDKNLANGSMSLVEYRMKWFGEDEDKAKEIVYEINGREGLIKRLDKYLPVVQSGLMTPKMFVNLAYTDEDLKKADTTRDELIAMLSGGYSAPDSISKDELEAEGGYDPNKVEKPSVDENKGEN